MKLYGNIWEKIIWKYWIVNVWNCKEIWKEKKMEIFWNIGIEICYLGKIIKWKMSTLPISFHIEVDHQCRCAMCPVHWWPKVHHYNEYFYIYKLISDSARYSVIKPTMWRTFDQWFSQQKISQEVEISKLKHIASIYWLLQSGHLHLIPIRFRSNISNFTFLGSKWSTLLQYIGAEQSVAGGIFGRGNRINPSSAEEKPHKKCQYLELIGNI